MKIGIIDYGVGNLASIQNAFERLGVESIVSSLPAELKITDALILPGDGAAGKGMQNLQQLELDMFLIEELQNEKPFLGICLGMQLLLTYSAEGNISCLNIVGGLVDKIKAKVKIPQIGWNTVVLTSETSKIMKNISNSSYFYFINSYICKPRKKSIIVGKTDYGETFCSAFENKNIFGVQFHPEKSGDSGMQVLKNFLEVAK